MNSEKYFTELTRRLGQADIATGAIENGMLTVKLDDNPACGVAKDGFVYRRPGDMVGPDSDTLYQQTEEIAGIVHEYLTEMENGPRMIVGGDSYSKLCEFNHAVLGGHEMSDGGYQFATWFHENDGDLRSGNYYGDNYEGAKQNFAERAGLVSHDQLFSNEQLVELYRCAQDTLDSEYELTDAQTKLIEKTQQQIERAVPDLRERIAQAQSLLMSEGQTFGG